MENILLLSLDTPACPFPRKKRLRTHEEKASMSHLLPQHTDLHPRRPSSTQTSQRRWCVRVCMLASSLLSVSVSGGGGWCVRLADLSPSLSLAPTSSCVRMLLLNRQHNFLLIPRCKIMFAGNSAQNCTAAKKRTVFCDEKKIVHKSKQQRRRRQRGGELVSW